MPIATANGREFDFPDGTTPAQMGDAIDEFFAHDKVAPLRRHAEANIANGLQVNNADGSTSTVRSGSVNHPGLNNGKITLIPFVWNGRVIESADEAAQLAIESGIDWPTFSSHEEATAASKSLSNSIKLPGQELPEGNVLSAIGDVAGTVLSGAAAVPIAGLAGIGEGLVTGDAGEAVRAIETSQEELTMQPRTQMGRDALLSLADTLRPVTEGLESAQQFLSERGAELAAPLGLIPGLDEDTARALGAGAGAAFPEAVGMAAGLPSRGVRAIPDAPRAPEVAAVADDLIPQQPEIPPANVSPPPPVAPTPQQAAQSVSGSIEDIALEANINPTVIQAAENLGIERPAAAGSRNPAFIEAVQAMKSRPGSPGLAEEVAAIDGLEQSSRQLINDLGGDTDRTLFNDQLASEIDTNILGLRAQAKNLYGRVNAALPRRLEVDPIEARQFLQERIDDVGGDLDRLSGSERALLGLMDAEQPVTYFALDRLRKDIGEGFNRRGTFADEADANLSEVYGVLSDVQSRVANSRGVGDIYTSARGAVTQRKALENRAVELFGRDLTKTINQRLRTSASGLTKGDLTNFRRLIEALPEHRRAQGAVQVLDQIFTLGARDGNRLGGGFASAFRGLQENPGALNELFGFLPDSAKARFNDMGVFADAVFRARSRTNNSLSARDVLAGIDQESTLRRIYDVGRQVAVREGATTAIGLPGAGTVGTIIAEGATTRLPRSMVIDDLIRSPAMAKAINDVSEGNIGRAEEALAKTKPFREFVKIADENSLQQIADVGFFAWLTAQEPNGATP